LGNVQGEFRIQKLLGYVYASSVAFEFEVAAARVPPV
jgi:hypothetical protein